MADTFARRCGCGAILRARQSCDRCAAEARARLHAAGVREVETAAAQRYVDVIDVNGKKCRSFLVL